MGVNFMPRFFISHEPELYETVVISGDDAHHIVRVLRLKEGDSLKLSDGKNTEIIVIIEDVDYKNLKIKARVIEKNKMEGVCPAITLFQGVPKGDRFDLIIQKNTEIGVSRFVPVITQRTVVELSGDKPGRRRERWQKIAREAAKQCLRLDIPEVSTPVDFEKSLEEIKFHQLAVVPWEEEKSASFRELLQNLSKKNISKIAVFIGPEGGFSQEEIEKAKMAGAFTVSLGPRILRTETAGIVVCSIIMYALGDLGGLKCRK
jgi:16S rRNA (uracil1498-N3)-methyltransferase